MQLLHACTCRLIGQNFCWIYYTPLWITVILLHLHLQAVLYAPTKPLARRQWWGFERCLPSPCLSTSDCYLWVRRVPAWYQSVFVMFSTAFHSATSSICVSNICFHHDRVRRRLQKALEDWTLSKSLASWSWGGWCFQQRNMKRCWKMLHMWILNIRYFYHAMPCNDIDSWLRSLSQNPKEWVGCQLSFGSVPDWSLLANLWGTSNGGTLPCNFVLGHFPWISFCISLTYTGYAGDFSLRYLEILATLHCIDGRVVTHKIPQ